MGKGEKLATLIAKPFVRAVTRQKRQKYINSLTSMSTNDLRAGDILIAQELDGASDSELDASFIRSGQAAFSHFGPGTTASATSEHVAMITDDGTQKNVESISIGVVMGHWLSKRKYLVYRYTGSENQMSSTAVVVAILLASDSLNVKEGDELVKYAGYMKVAASVFRRKKAGHFANKRIERIIELCNELQSRRKTKEDLRSESLGMICSELIATCYEVAAYQLLGKGVLNVDPRAMTAKALEATLNRNSDFTLQGVFEGKVDVEKVDITKLHPLTFEMIYREMSMGNTVIDNKVGDPDEERMEIKTVCSLMDPFKLQYSSSELERHFSKGSVTVTFHAAGPATLFKESYEITFVGTLNDMKYSVTNRIEAPKQSSISAPQTTST